MKIKFACKITILLVLHNDAIGLFESRELDPFFFRGVTPQYCGVKKEFID